MQLIIETHGAVRCVYTEAINLATIGQLSIARASHVEPDEAGRWLADLAPVGGPRLGPYARRSNALAAEVEWLQKYWLFTEPPA